jgi:hypothetical protein
MAQRPVVRGEAVEKQIFKRPQYSVPADLSPRLLEDAGVLVLAGIVFYFNSGGFCGGETLKLVVKGDSMAGIVENGEKVKVRKGYYDCHEIKRDDIVAYRYGKEELLVKRVVAVPGDSGLLTTP